LIFFVKDDHGDRRFPGQDSCLAANFSWPKEELRVEAQLFHKSQPEQAEATGSVAPKQVILKF
jgi:hypothetical protein